VERTRQGDDSRRISGCCSFRCLPGTGFLIHRLVATYVVGRRRNSSAKGDMRDLREKYQRFAIVNGASGWNSAFLGRPSTASSRFWPRTGPGIVPVELKRVGGGLEHSTFLDKTLKGVFGRESSCSGSYKGPISGGGYVEFICRVHQTSHGIVPPFCRSRHGRLSGWGRAVGVGYDTLAVSWGAFLFPLIVT